MDKMDIYTLKRLYAMNLLHIALKLKLTLE